MKGVAVMGIFIPSDEAGNHGCDSPLILGGPASPSGSGEGFLFLAARAPGNAKEWGGERCKERTIISKQFNTDSYKGASYMNPGG